MFQQSMSLAGCVHVTGSQKTVVIVTVLCQATQNLSEVMYFT